MTTLVYDIETIPDLQGARLIMDGLDVSDQDIHEIIQTKRLQKTQGQSFWPHHLQKIIAISVLVLQADQIKVWSLGEIDATEKELIERFFHGIEKYVPTLVSWNGSGFDLPVLHYRSLINGVVAAQYWELGQNQSDFRWNNYLGRYHLRHLDLMDILSGYQARAVAPLDDIAKLLRLPGKQILSGNGVWKAYQEGAIGQIRDYCEIDVINTYLVFLRFQYMRGLLSAVEYEHQYLNLKSYLQSSDKEHFLNFEKDLPSCSL